MVMSLYFDQSSFCFWRLDGLRQCNKAKGLGNEAKLYKLSCDVLVRIVRRDPARRLNALIRRQSKSSRQESANMRRSLLSDLFLLDAVFPSIQAGSDRPQVAAKPC